MSPTIPCKSFWAACGNSSVDCHADGVWLWGPADLDFPAAEDGERHTAEALHSSPPGPSRDASASRMEMVSPACANPPQLLRHETPARRPCPRLLRRASPGRPAVSRRRPPRRPAEDSRRGVLRL